MGALSMCVKINLSVKTCVWYIYFFHPLFFSHYLNSPCFFLASCKLHFASTLASNEWMNEWLGVCVQVHNLDAETFALRKVETLDIASNSKCYWSYVVGGSEIDLTNFSSVKTGCGPLTQGWQVYSLVAQILFSRSWVFFLLSSLSSWNTHIVGALNPTNPTSWKRTTWRCTYYVGFWVCRICVIQLWQLTN